MFVGHTESDVLYESIRCPLINIFLQNHPLVSEERRVKIIRIQAVSRTLHGFLLI